jgi:hypothetical protein
MKNIVKITALVFTLCIISFGCANQSNSSVKILDQNLTVRQFSGSSPQSMAVVHGRAQNVKNIKINSTTISVNFYDKDKRTIATGSAVKQNLQPGEVWDFSVQTVGPDAWKILTYDIAISTE